MATAAILGMTAAQSNVVITYNCATYASECASNVNAGNTAISVCSRGFEACLDCNAHEFACRVSAGNSYPGQLNCTSDSEVCYNNAVSPGQTSGYYGCEQAQNSCVNGPMENESLCASQNSACKWIEIIKANRLPPLVG